MPWANNPPYALFVLANLGSEKINEILGDAESSIGAPEFWLATEQYSDAPSKERPDNKANLGTEPPISEEFVSPFVDCKVEDVGKWLRDKPDEVDLDGHHFAVLDGKSADGSVLVCKLGDKDLNGDTLDSRRLESGKRACTFLMGLEYGEWEELKGM